MDDPRETIARAIAGDEAHQIWDDPDQCECCVGWKRDMYMRQAADVIKALGLTEQLGSRSHGTGLMDCGVTPGPDILGRHNHRRWVTEWEEVDE